jgi:hypothetical protein
LSPLELLELLEARTAALSEIGKEKLRGDTELAALLRQLSELASKLSEPDAEVGSEDLLELEELQDELTATWSAKLDSAVQIPSVAPAELSGTDCPYCGTSFEVPGLERGASARLKAHVRKLHPREAGF